ncbi:MAG TPA: DUF3037 domain-containing protein [Longimicrobiaceae bacterium]|nr:DUF3037 domain-containing protein [Longimicrobiaceae bacterium]
METQPRWIAYDFAVVRAVPHPYLGTCVPVGVVLHARTEEFLGARLLTEPEALAARVPDVDAELLARYLRAWEALCAGRPEAGPVALAPQSERFHWLTAPRSDVLQPGPVHGGLCRDPATVLDELFAAYVLGTGPRPTPRPAR